MLTTVPHDVLKEERSDGSMLLKSRVPADPMVRNTGEWLTKWAAATPSRVFIAERAGAGWREESYASVLQQVGRVAEALLARGLTSETPIVALSGTGVDHGVLALAAQYIGVPLVPLAEQYSLIPEAHDRLIDAIEMVRPKMAFTAHAGKFAKALGLDAMDGIEIIASDISGAPGAATAFADLLKGDASVDLAAAHAAVGPDTLAKIMLTSGSTSKPKGVLTTHKMICVNQAQMSAAMPFLAERPPLILDWLPWNHTFGGTHNFNMMLANGGSLYLDDGRPTKQDFGRTLENLRVVASTLSMNVPVHFAMLLDAVRKDAELKRKYFENLDMIFYAAASLPKEIWDGLEQAAVEIRGEKPLMISSWGMTETAPASIQVHEHVGRAGAIGVPLPDVDVKLLPLEENRFELRVAGPNVMPGYFNAPEKTAESFDEDGFLITGDAVKLRDPHDINAGLVFDGRTSEDFKLLSGTWVRAATLRVSLLGLLDGLVHDLVVVGQDKSEVGILIFPLPDALGGETEDGALIAPDLASVIAARLADANRTSGSSMRIARGLLMAEPPSVKDAEITPKGSLNPRKILSRRARLSVRLYDNDDPATFRM